MAMEFDVKIRSHHEVLTILGSGVQAELAGIEAELEVLEARRDELIEQRRALYLRAKRKGRRG